MSVATVDHAAAERSVLRRGAELLWEMIRTHPIPFAAAVAGSTVFAVASVGGAIVLGRVTDEVIVPALDGEGIEARAAVLGGAAIVVVAVVRAIGVVARRYFGSMTTRRMQKTWFERLADHYLSQPLRFFLRQPTGKLLAHSEADAEASTFAMQPLPLSIGLVVMIGFATIQLALVDAWLLAVAVALLPALSLANRLYTRRVEAPSARAQAAVGDVSSIAHESFEGALIVKLLGLQGHESERMADAADRLRGERLRVGRLRAAFEPSLDAIPQLGTIGLLVAGSWRIEAGAITTGDLVEAMAIFAILAFPMRVLGFLLEELPRSVVARDRLVRVLAEDHTAHAAVQAAVPDRRPLPEGPLGVDVSGLRYGYVEDAEPVLDGLDVSVAPGEIVALVGATGAGKSTLCHLVSGLIRPDAGTVAIGGVDIAGADPLSVQRAVSLVFQETFLFGGSVTENLAAGHDTDRETLHRALRTAQAGFALELPEGLDTVVGERGVTLSGGQRQRLALARALLREPRVLLLDDATSAVDPVVEGRILAALGEELSTTTVVVAHRVATIRLADRVLFIHGGRIRAAGTHEELIASDDAYELLVRAYEEQEVT